MEISTDPDGTVYVRWHGGGPWTVLTEDGQVTTEHGLGGQVEWFEAGNADERGDYDDGFEAGLEESKRKAADARAARKAKAGVR